MYIYKILIGNEIVIGDSSHISN